MAKFAGRGGWWAIPTDTQFAFKVHNTEYEILTEEEIHYTRSAGCGGWEEALPVVRRVALANFRVPEDDEFYPQVLGFTEGMEFPVIYLRRGSLDEYDALYQSVVKSVRRMKDEKKAIWVEIVCHRGRLVRNVAPPLFPESE